MEEKTREKIFSRNTDFASKQRWKKIVLKKCENTFFINTHEYRDQKMGGKNARKFFFPKSQVYREIKTMEKNRLEKCEKRFL